MKSETCYPAGFCAANAERAQLVRSICHEQAVHLVVRAGLGGVRVRRDDLFAPKHALDAQNTHQPFNRAAGDILALAPQNVRDLPRTIEFAIVLPGRIYPDAQGGIRLRPRGSPVRAARWPAVHNRSTGQSVEFYTSARPRMLPGVPQ